MKKQEFAKYLELDLHDRGWQQQDLLPLLAEGEVAPLTASAITMWKGRGHPPERWLNRLVEILGPNSAIAQAVARGDLGEHFTPTNEHTKSVAEAKSVISYARRGLAPHPAQLSDQAKNLAVLFDMLPNDPITRAIAYNKLSEILIRELRPAAEAPQA